MTDMYFDPSKFDFTSLVDVIETNEPAPKNSGVKASAITADGGKVEDISDLSDLFDDEEQAEPETETDVNADVSDLIPEENHTEAIKIFEDLPDDALITFNGKTMTKAEANEVFAIKEQLEKEREIVSVAAKSIDDIHRFIEQDYHRHQTALDTNIDVIQRKLNSNISAVEYGEEARKLQSALEARNELNRRTDEKMRLLDLERAEISRININAVDNAMRAEVKEWDQVKGKLLKDIQDRGGNLAALEKVWSKNMAMDLLDAWRYRNQKGKAQAAALEAAKAKAPRSTSTAATAQRQKVADAKEAQKRALLAKQAKGGLDRNDHAKLFEFLTD